MPQRRRIGLENISRKSWTRQAWLEFKIARQVSTGSGAAFLEADAFPSRQFVEVELGYGMGQRPCTDCQKPCTLDYTLSNLEELNQRNRITYSQREGESIETTASVERRRQSAAKARRQLRSQLRRGGVVVHGGEYSPPTSWIPSNPTRGSNRRQLGLLLGPALARFFAGSEQDQ
jgi:hypothetical protein